MLNYLILFPLPQNFLSCTRIIQKSLRFRTQNLLSFFLKEEKVKVVASFIYLSCVRCCFWFFLLFSVCEGLWGHKNNHVAHILCMHSFKIHLFAWTKKHSQCSFVAYCRENKAKQNKTKLKNPTKLQ